MPRSVFVFARQDRKPWVPTSKVVLRKTPKGDLAYQFWLNFQPQNTTCKK